MITYHKKPISIDTTGLSCMCNDCLRLDSENFGLLVCYQPPLKRLVNVEYLSNIPKYHAEKIRGAYFLSMPYTFYKISYIEITSGIKVISMCVAFGAEKDFPHSNSTLMYKVPLGNVKREGSICFGGKKLDCLTDNFYKETIAYFWQSMFNDEICDNIIKGTNLVWSKSLGNPNVWLAKTKENPEWMPSHDDLVQYHNFFPINYNDYLQK